MPKKLIDRRTAIIGGTIAVAATATSNHAFCAQPQPQESHTKEAESKADQEKPPENYEQAIERLLNGNKRFVQGQLNHPHSATDWRKRLVGAQKPFATILGCSDSRVPPELLFDQGFGDLFVIRVAGNVIDTDVAGSVEYGVDHLQTKLVVVMGHEGCGAVTAALQSQKDLAKEPNEIQSLVGKIKPAIRNFDSDVTFAQRLKISVEDNVRNSVKRLQEISDLALAEKESRTKIVGLVYEIETGKVRII